MRQIKQILLLLCFSFCTYAASVKPVECADSEESIQKIVSWCADERLNAMHDHMTSQVEHAVTAYVTPFRWNTLHYRLTVADMQNLLRKNRLSRIKYFWQSDIRYLREKKELLLSTWIQRQLAVVLPILSSNNHQIVREMTQVGACSVQMHFEERYVLRGLQSGIPVRERELHLVCRAYDAQKNIISLKSLDPALFDQIDYVIEDCVKL